MVKLIMGNVFTAAHSEDTLETQAVYDALSYIVPGADHIKRRNRRLRKWTGVKSFFDRRNRCFLTGFIWIVAKALTANGIQYEVIDRRVRQRSLNCRR